MSSIIKLLPRIQEILEQGKSQREIAEHFDFKDKYVVKELLKRERAIRLRIAENSKLQSPLPGVFEADESYFGTTRELLTNPHKIIRSA